MLDLQKQNPLPFGEGEQVPHVQGISIDGGRELCFICMRHRVGPRFRNSECIFAVSAC